MRREGKRIRTGNLEVRVLASPLAHPRVGVVVPRFKHTAVERNRLKRRLRELIRLRLLPVLPAVDVVVRPFPPAYALSFEALAMEMERAMRQIARQYPVA